MMGINRREFLKIAGWSALLGAGGKSAFELLAPGEAEALLQPDPLKAKQWAMAIDFTKMDEEVMGAAIKACHRLYNVPDMGNPKVELKWIWKETYEHTFPTQENEYIAEQFHHQQLSGSVQPLHQPPLLQSMPHQGHVEKRRRHRDDGYASLHRVSVLYGGMPIWRKELQLGRPPSSSQRAESGFPDESGIAHPVQGCGGKVSVLCGAACKGPDSSMRGSGQCRQDGRHVLWRPHGAGFAREKGPSHPLLDSS